MGKYILTDTFNDRAISRHNKLGAAVKREHVFSAAVSRVNGRGSYIPTEIKRADGAPLTDRERAEIREAEDALRSH